MGELQLDLAPEEFYFRSRKMEARLKKGEVIVEEVASTGRLRNAEVKG